MDNRALPVITVENEYFWRAGESGILHILRCGACGLWIHPASPICRRCHSKDVRPEAVSGRGSVFSFTVNYHRWRPDLEVPFVFASVELVEQQDLKVSTEIVGCAPEDVRCGLDVDVEFLRVDDVWLPRFTPATNERRTSEA
jgi:uncharacterized OB-fold protein